MAKSESKFSKNSRNFLAKVKYEYEETLQMSKRHCIGQELNQIYQLIADRRTETIKASRQKDGVESGAYEPTKRLIRKIAKEFGFNVEFDDDPPEDEGIIEITE